MKCRIDKNSELVELFTLGDIYISDFIPMDDNSEDYEKTPLTMCLSEESGLVQLKDTADFDKMYSRYWYHSGTNKTMTNELRNIVFDIKSLVDVNENDIWLDIGCNDGTLLKAVGPYVYTVGIDPAKNNCKKAFDVATTVINDYFNAPVFYKTVGDRRAKVITSIAMFYDLPDPKHFCNEIYKVLDDEGLWVIQMSYLPLMLDQLAFDNICHEHLEYYSLGVLKNLLEDTGFRVVDCKLNDINGGSFRIYVRKASADVANFGSAPYRDVCNFRINSILSHEEKYDLKNPQTYIDWFAKVNALKDKTVKFIEEEVNNGKTVFVYGASTKGNTLLQYFGLDHRLISGASERQEQKFGLKTVGTDIPIYSEAEVREMNPDYMLVLPWHFINEFVEREQEYLKSGGKFIVPCPEFKIIGY